MKQLFLIGILFLGFSCSKKDDMTPANAINYQTQLIGTWTGMDKNSKGLANYPVTIVIDASTITIRFIDAMPSNRTNPTVWTYQYIASGDKASPKLQISSTYAWLVTVTSITEMSDQLTMQKTCTH